MLKDAFYFSHDANAHSDPKILKLLQKHDWAGYGLYWAIIEMLRNESNFKLETDYDSIAFALRTHTEFIKSIIEDFKLFVIEDNYFSSLSLLKRMELKEEKSNKARESAKIRWENANAKQTQSERNAKKGKEKKGKEKKTIKNIYKVEDRMTEFELEVMEHKGEYPPEILQEFWDYWSELNKSKTKMKKELQQTWDTSRRLKTWIRNKEKFEAKNGTNKKDSPRGTIDFNKWNNELNTIKPPSTGMVANGDSK